MKAKRSFHTRRLLDILRVYEAAEGLLLLAGSPPLVAIRERESFNSDSLMVAGSDGKALRQQGVVDEKVGVLSADDLMSHFPMIRKGACQLVYCRRKNRCGDQVPIVDDGRAVD
ncbi:hypothetical protein Hanom_Chr12g01131941 [Helianthus anomalus]